MTGLPYKKRKYGPALERMLPVHQEMVGKKEIAVVPVLVGSKTQDRIIALRDPDMTKFSDHERHLIDQVVAIFWDKTAGEISEDSHGIAYRAHAMDEQIPYQAIFVSDEALTKGDIAWATKEAGKIGLN